jgi:RNA polymerase sigma-70 factor, ECF subfamily
VEPFEEFFLDHYASLTRALLLVVGNEAEAEDVVQGAFARAWENWSTIRDMESPVGYVYRTAVNLHRNRLRRLGRELRRRPSRVPNDPIEDADTRESIRRALASLPINQREALILTEWLGFDSEQAGRVLGIKPASVRVRVHRARIELRRSEGETDESG